MRNACTERMATLLLGVAPLIHLQVNMKTSSNMPMLSWRYRLARSMLLHIGPRYCYQRVCALECERERERASVR
jgi:hypothetical protein